MSRFECQVPVNALLADMDSVAKLAGQMDGKPTYQELTNHDSESGFCCLPAESKAQPDIGPGGVVFLNAGMDFPSSSSNSDLDSQLVPLTSHSLGLA